MVIPQELMEKWKVLRSPGDAAKISEQIGDCSEETINRAFREGKCSDEVFKGIADFYDAKAKLIREYL
jgi:hypothetical protein